MTIEQLKAEVDAVVRSAGVGGLTTAAEVRQLIKDIIDQLFQGLAGERTFATDGLAGKVALQGDQSVDGSKTFVTIPKSSGTPVAPNDLITKAYLESVLASFGIADLNFDGNRAITRQVDGIEGVNLGTATVKNLLEKLLYPPAPPVLTIGLAAPSHEYGDTGPVAVNWTVTPGAEVITGISISGNAVAPTGSYQTGTLNGAVNPTADTTFTLLVTTADGSSYTMSVTSTVSRKIRAGYSTKNGTSQPIIGSDLNAIAGAFSDSRELAIQIIIPVSNYMVIAIPSAYISGATTFVINGFLVNDFNKVRTNWPYTNAFGYTENFDVWVSKNYMTGTNNLNIS